MQAGNISFITMEHHPNLPPFPNNQPVNTPPFDGLTYDKSPIVKPPTAKELTPASLDLTNTVQLTYVACCVLHAPVQERRPTMEIAAIALANGHGLVTRNPAHFADIPHRRVEGYWPLTL